MISLESKNKEKFTKLLVEILDNYQSTKNRMQKEYRTFMKDGDYIKFKTRSVNAITNIAGYNSVYVLQLREILQERDVNKEKRLEKIIGLVQALYEDLAGDYLSSVTELIRGEVFSDFLEQGEYLLEKGYKDAAAVIAGSTLENHLKKLCQKSGIEISIQKENKKIQKKANTLKDDLAKNNIISKTDQKQLTFWLDIRNKSAHGEYEHYTKEQVELFILGLRNFISSNPA